MYHKIKDKTIKWTLENQKWLEEYIYILYIYIQMVKINYVIATYNGKCNRQHKYPLPKDV